jgi:hypothetical protein
LTISTEGSCAVFDSNAPGDNTRPSLNAHPRGLPIPEAGRRTGCCTRSPFPTDCPTDICAPCAESRRGQVFP